MIFFSTKTEEKICFQEPQTPCGSVLVQLTVAGAVIWGLDLALFLLLT